MSPKDSQFGALESLPAMTMKQRQRLEREAAILEEAERMLATEGYIAMAMDGLAARLGIATGTLYQHFASKEELAIGVAVNSAERQRAFIEGQDPAVPAFDRLTALMRWRIERRFRYEWPDVEALKYVIRSQTKQRPEMQARMDRRDEAVARLIDEAKAQGTIRKEIDTSVLVHVLMHGIATYTLPKVAADRERTPEQLTDSLLSILIDGIRTAA